MDRAPQRQHRASQGKRPMALPAGGRDCRRFRGGEKWEENGQEVRRGGRDKSAEEEGLGWGAAQEGETEGETGGGAGKMTEEKKSEKERNRKEREKREKEGTGWRVDGKGRAQVRGARSRPSKGSECG